jgi:hypothetical protein
MVPTIESRYSVRAERTGRAPAGLSMGGGQTMNIGFAHLDKFAYLGAFSSGPHARLSEQLRPDSAASASPAADATAASTSPKTSIPT